MFWIGVQQCFFLRVGLKSSRAVSRDGSGRSERVGAVPPVVEELRVKASKPSSREKKKKEKDEEESLISCCFCLFFVLTVAGQTFSSLSTLLTHDRQDQSRRFIKLLVLPKVDQAAVSPWSAANRRRDDRRPISLVTLYVPVSVVPFFCAWADLDVSREDDVTLFLLMLQNRSLFDEE